jgi:hypothetical protein
MTKIREGRKLYEDSKQEKFKKVEGSRKQRK